MYVPLRRSEEGSHRRKTQAKKLERSKHGARRPKMGPAPLSFTSEEKIKIVSPDKRRMESHVVQKPKARCVLLELKSQRIPNKVLMCESLRRESPVVRKPKARCVILELK